jgi:hypothetical protein
VLTILENFSIRSSLDVDRLFTMSTYVIESNKTRHVPVLHNLDKHIIKIMKHNRKDNMNTKLFIEISFEMQVDDDADGNPVFKLYYFNSRNPEFFLNKEWMSLSMRQLMVSDQPLIK